MKLKLVSKSEVLDIERYFVYPINEDRILITKNCNELTITDHDFSQISSFEIEGDQLISYEYFSDDKSQFLWNSEGYYLRYLNLSTEDFKIKKRIPDDLSLIQYYVWDEDKFILVGLEANLSNIPLFFSYDVNLNKLNQLSCSYVLRKYPFFQNLFECLKNNYLLHYNIKKEILVYRELRDDGNDEIILQSSSCKKTIKVNYVDKEVHRADFLDDFLVLVHKEYVVFYYAGVEFFSINMNKKDWAFCSAYLFKHGDDFYCLVTQLDTYQPKRNIIEIYKIEK